MQTTIQTELENEQYAGKSALEIHALLTAPTRDYMVEPKTSDVSNYLFNNQMGAALIVAKLSPNYDQFPTNLKVAMEFAINLRADNTPNMNFDNAGTRAMTDGFVAAGIWTAAQVEGLLETLARRKRSRSMELWGREVSIEEVARVVNADAIAAEEGIQGASRLRLQNLYRGIDANANEVTN